MPVLCVSLLVLLVPSSCLLSPFVPLVWVALYLSSVVVCVSIPLLGCPLVPMASRVQKMSFLFWNMQGLGDTDKCDLVRNSISAAAPAVACLQESKLAALEDHKARSFLPISLSEFLSKDACGHCLGPPSPFARRLR